MGTILIGLLIALLVTVVVIGIAEDLEIPVSKYLLSFCAMLIVSIVIAATLWICEDATLREEERPMDYFYNEF